MSRDLGRLLIAFGVIAVIAGIVITTGNRLGLGRLPGDFSWRRGSVGCYFPLMTSILLSLALSLILWLLRR